MFGKRKNDASDASTPKKKKQNKVDTLLMGMIVGGAVGSVIGMTLSPQSGKENRDYIKKKTRQTWEKSQMLLGEVVKRKQEKKKGIWHTLNKIFIKDKDE